MARIALLSMHTSPLEQAGAGDGGGLNVYVREVGSALARAGTACDVYTRAADPLAPLDVVIEPGLVVHHVPAGPVAPLEKSELASHVGEFADGVAAVMAAQVRAGEQPTTVLHANYWLSGMAGHILKHRLGLPLVTSFHTLDRVKASASPEDVDPLDPGRRAREEAAVIGCSDAVIASCSVEVAQLVELYDANPARVVVVPPGVDPAFFSPGDRLQARRALAVTLGGRFASGARSSCGMRSVVRTCSDWRRRHAGPLLDVEAPLLLYVGRIQPLKGTEVAIGALAALEQLGVPDATLLVVGGPSGPGGAQRFDELRAFVEEAGLGAQVRFVPPQRHELLSTFYRAADCCIVPSRSESFGLVALEAAACGTPVVASAVGGLTTLVEHGITGYLVEERGADAFAGFVARILGDAALKKSLGEAGSLKARAYSWAFAAAKLRQAYATVADSTLVECR